MQQNGCCLVNKWEEPAVAGTPQDHPVESGKDSPVGILKPEDTLSQQQDAVVVAPATSVSSSNLCRPSSALSISSTVSSASHSVPACIKRSNSTSTVASTEQKSEAESVTCRWSECSEQMDSGLLMQHLCEGHVHPQAQGKSYVCKWEGCKVYNKPSCNKSWLERHILSHSGDKPFCCIVDGCGMRFVSQFSLERHVNGHFNAELSAQPKSNRNRDDTPSKASKKRKVRRKRVWQGE